MLLDDLEKVIDSVKKDLASEEAKVVLKTLEFLLNKAKEFNNHSDKEGLKKIERIFYKKCVELPYLKQHCINCLIIKEGFISSYHKFLIRGFQNL